MLDLQQWPRTAMAAFPAGALVVFGMDLASGNTRVGGMVLTSGDRSCILAVNPLALPEAPDEEILEVNGVKFVVAAVPTSGLQTWTCPKDCVAARRR